MNRAMVVLATGASVVAVAAFLALWAASFTTDLQGLGAPAWGDTTDPALEKTYPSVVLSLLCFGLVVVAITAWNRLPGERGVQGETRPRWR